MGRLGLYLRTARHLRWEQVVFRVLRRVQVRRPVRLHPRCSRAGGLQRQAIEAAIAGWGAGDAEMRLTRAREVVEGRFTFLNHTEWLSPIDWKGRYVSHLWNYNLHYFDYAVDLAWAHRLSGDDRFRDQFVALALEWAEGTTTGDSDGWEPYATSLRVVNWIRALSLFGDSIAPGERLQLESSLAIQIEYVSRRLELHILANHLQKNLKALIFGGLYFSGPSPRKWLRKGVRLQWREVLEQVLPDGGHYERSPMYHAIALEDHLETFALLGACDQKIPEGVVERVRRMVHAMGALSGPEGHPHLFNDAARGIAPLPMALSSLTQQVLGESVPVPQGIFDLPLTGYFGFAQGAGLERLLIDCGPLGPDYQPGHGHCDLLSFEWYIDGRAVVVDSGVSGYEGDPLREYVRSTRAHNTVTLDDLEQAELWGTFRLAGRPTGISASHAASGSSYNFKGEYRPYHDPRVVHRRRIEWREDLLEVEDRVEGAGGRVVRSYLHLHPDFTVRADDKAHIAFAEGVELMIEHWGVDRVEIARGEQNPAQGWYCPEFGVRMPAPVLVFSTRGGASAEFGYRLRIVGSRQRTDSIHRQNAMNS